MLKEYVRKAGLRIANAPSLRRKSFGDREIALPASSRLELSESEPWMYQTLSALLSRFDGGLLDVGVNLGQTLVEYKSLRPNGVYLGIEPNPECVAYATQLVRANGFENITIIPAALADRAGLIKLEFYEDNEFDSSASIIPNFREDRPVRRSEYIASITGKELLTEFDMKDIGIVKIDVEGAELAVLQELVPLFAGTRPVVTVEVLPAYSADNHRRVESQTGIEHLIRAHGYELFRLEHDATTLSGFRQLDEFGIYSDIAMSDYVLVPKERVGDIQAAAAEYGLSFTASA